jgi:hypothetical protein
MKKWVIGASVVGGIGLLVWLAKKSADSFAAKVQQQLPTSVPPATVSTSVTPAAVVPAPMATPSSVPAPDVVPTPAGAPAQMYVPIYAYGQLTGQTMLWTASDEQSKLVGPRYPSYYDLDYGRFVFPSISGSGYSWVTLDASGHVTSSGSTTQSAAA